MLQWEATILYRIETLDLLGTREEEKGENQVQSIDLYFSK